MTEAVSLEACPFCGGAGDIESQPSYSQAANTHSRYRGWCDQCAFGLDWQGYEPDAIAAWNRRTQGPEQVAEVERARDTIRERAIEIVQAQRRGWHCSGDDCTEYDSGRNEGFDLAVKALGLLDPLPFEIVASIQTLTRNGKVERLLRDRADADRKKQQMHYKEGRPWRHFRYAAEVLDDIADKLGVVQS